MTDSICQLSVKALLTDKVDYVIPMYQRNFAWDEAEIAQLIQDVIDYLPDKKNYYIGTLVVAERQEGRRTVFETIDGQQRLTTLSLLASYLKNRKDVTLNWYEDIRIHFENREHSSLTFKAIFEGKFKDDPSEVLREQDINTSILNGYRLIAKLLPLKLKEEKCKVETFAEYLFDMVQIIRVQVPHDTDLNHYFEIMNNRGEQLEKHEVLKARMLEVLNSIKNASQRKASQNCLHRVWEACANMEKYVQLGFTPKLRDKIFGVEDWGDFKVGDFDGLCDILGDLDEDETSGQNLDQIISVGKTLDEPERDTNDDAPERFNTVINFPNFLLHVLRIVTKNENNIQLDDKKLLTTFEQYLNKSENKVEAVKQFIYSLLYCKYLLDNYVIKREFAKGEDGWSLKRFKWIKASKGRKGGRGSYENTFDDKTVDYNRRILMLLSAFHVSTPTLVYKHWLSAALNHLYSVTLKGRPIQSVNYHNYLESVARAFVFDRFLVSNGGLDYNDIIFTNDGKCKTTSKGVSDDDLKEMLSFGRIENNLVFNYLDYLLWVNNEISVNKDKKIGEYEFTFRSSVEHYYPQHPMPGHPHLEPEKLNSFGNLCLISHSKNSRLSNFMPAAKKEYYSNNTIDSIKQHLMMKSENWDSLGIDAHYGEMKRVLLESLT